MRHDRMSFTSCRPGIVSAPYSDISTGLLYFLCQASASPWTLSVIMSILPALLYQAL